MHPTDTTLPANPPRDEFERFFLLAFDMCCVSTIEGRILRANPAFVRGLGYCEAEAELLGKSYQDLVHPEDLARTVAELERVAGGMAESLFVNRLRHRDGSYRWLEWTPSVPTPDGQFYAIARDVTEHRRITEALRRSEQKYRLLAENSTDIILLTSPDGEIQYASPACERLLGCESQTLVGAKSYELIHPEDLSIATAAHLQALQTGTGRAIYRVVSRAGRETWLEVIKKAIFDPATGQPQAVQSVSRDVTERFELDRRREQFVSTVAHELRTPLSSLFGSLRLLASGKLEADPASSRRILDIAVNNAERLTRLIDDLLEFERLNSGTAVMELEACNAQDLLLQLEDTMRPIAERAGVELEVLVASLPMRADPDRVVQVLLNLVGNALKFTPAGRAVRVSARAEAGGVRFEVADQGRGIPAHMHERIFERFQQVTRSDATEKGGAGLGLAICRGLVEAHGGRIGVESEEGAGSLFWFTLPA